MRIPERFAAQKSWLKGGIVGAAICALLFGFYLFIYFPTLYATVQVDPSGDEPSWSLVLPTATGHILPLMTHFIIEGSSLPKKVCTETETHCISWTSEYAGGGVPWSSEEGSSGYCLEQATSPLASCIERLEGAASLIAIVFLELAYFIVGAILAAAIERRKKRASI